jgi:hypothetical protein
MNRKLGRLTKELKMSPYVRAAAIYYKNMQYDFSLIQHAIVRFGGKPDIEEQNDFLALMKGRGF